TMNDIAEAAGVAVETVYRGFSSKAVVSQSAVEAAVAGGAERAAVPAEERPAIRAVIDEPDPRRQQELYAATQPGIHGHPSNIRSGWSPHSRPRSWNSHSAQLDPVWAIPSRCRSSRRHLPSR
ncbi:MAG: TetR family transcriptional regulator, partial [Nitriliruptorales bacterium]|nr:TetR family transcriptional regulator [Nitriliruptorales bacterium]